MNIHSLKKDWRSQYIRILEKGPKVGLVLGTPEYDLERSYLQDLADADFIRIQFTFDGWTWQGTTLNGRIMTDVFKDDSPRKKFLKILTYVLVWLSGILSALLINWISNKWIPKP